MTQVTSWKEALERLTQGNKRFMGGLISANALLGNVRLKELAQTGQKPFAIVFSCSDSRVPAELLFDCGFGDLFVIRVAGNVVQPSQIASIEYAAKILEVPLCLVMGHSQCGAVQVALEAEEGKLPDMGPNIAFLVELLRPAVQTVLDKKIAPPLVLEECIHENVKRTANEIMKRSPLINSMVNENRFKIVEAVFHLETGQAEFMAL